MDKEIPVIEKSLIEKQTMKKVIWRLVPFLMICYLMAFIDRGNVGMASLQMNQDLAMSAKVFGFGSSLFFISRMQTFLCKPQKLEMV